VLALLATVSVLLCALGTPAAGATHAHLLAGGPGPAPRSFYGVMAADDPTSTEAARMGEAGVGTLRINLVWAWVQPDSPSEFDWDHYDQVIGAAARNGVQVLPTIYGSPSWAALRENYPPWQGNVLALRAFAEAAAQRYGTGGTFWTTHPDIPPVPVTWWQLWNEVSSSNFWDATPNAKEYVDLLRVFREGIKQGDPGARIVLAGLFPTPIAPNSILFRPYLRALYKRGAKPLFDAAAIHPYGATPQIAVQHVRAMRKLMSRYGDARKPIWVSEIGWATEGLPGPLTVSPEQQATYLTNTYRKLAAARERLKIAGVIWFSFRDSGGLVWFDHAGLLTTHLDPKPSWAAFLRLTGARG
jgi:polysaccharide biosynthesis protein PslG